MRLDRLHLQGLRCITDMVLDLAPGFNVLLGENGAGKTSVLEAVFLLSHGRSFRQGAREALVQRESSDLRIFAAMTREDGMKHRVGLGRGEGRWEARLDGENVALSQLLRECAVVCFEPGSHALIAGPGEIRRSFLDWGLFHVEQGFLLTWRRYQRALKQRNSLLRGIPDPEASLLDAWERELARTGAMIDGWRRNYLDALVPLLQQQASGLLPELGAMQLRYRRGWPEDECLSEILSAQRVRDRSKGHTTSGAHRANWSLSFEHAPQREYLSRGQEKLTALICVLGQAWLAAEKGGEWPIICLDDLASELDQTHQEAVIDSLKRSVAQILVTGTGLPMALKALPARKFHVEQGRLTSLL